MLAGCGGPQSRLAPSGSFQQGSTQSRVQGTAIAAHSNDGRSWMDPDAKTKDLLYVTNPGLNEVLVYSYPQSKLVGTLTQFYFVPDGVCTDKKGDVWIVNNNAQEIVEYKHGGTTQIASLSDPGY